MPTLIGTPVGMASLAASALVIVPAALAIRRLAAWRWDADAPLPIVLALGCAATLSAAAAAPSPTLFGASLGLGWVLVALAVLDLAILRLPDALTLPLIACGFVIGDGPLVDRLIGAFAGYAVFAAVAYGYKRLRHRHGLGLGDAKLLAAAGAWLGWRPLPVLLVIASTAGLVWAAVSLAHPGKQTLLTPMAFGPMLALALWLCWLWSLMIT